MDLTILEEAAAVLRAIYKGIPQEFKSKYRQTLWEQVQSMAAGEARKTNDLATFISRACLRLEGATLAPYEPEAREYVEALLRRSLVEQQAILKAIREQAAVCVLLLRNRLQEERIVNQAEEVQA